MIYSSPFPTEHKLSIVFIETCYLKIIPGIQLYILVYSFNKKLFNLKYENHIKSDLLS